MRRALLIVLVNLLVFVGLVGFLFLGLEIYLRTSDALQVDISLYSPFNYRLNPLFNGYFHGGYVTINKLGLRGPETSRDKPPGTIRIAFFGDSYTFGDEIDLEDTFPYLVQEMLDVKGNRLLEVLNFGVPGYDTVREYSYLKEDGLSFEPDIVAVVYVYNDAVYHIEREAGQVRKPSLVRSIKDYLSARSYAFFYIRRGLRTMNTMLYFRSLLKAQEKALPAGAKKVAASPTDTQGGSPKTEGLVGDKAPPVQHPSAEKPKQGPEDMDFMARVLRDRNVLLYQDSNPGWKEVKRGIRLFQALAEERGIKLFFVLYPFTPIDDPVTMEGYRIIQGKLKDAIGPNTPTIDLLQIFENKNISWDGHPKRAPNVEAAKAIVSLLEREGWLDRKPLR